MKLNEAIIFVEQHGPASVDDYASPNSVLCKERIEAWTLIKNALSALETIVDDFFDDGCEGCGTVSCDAINEGRAVLGYEPLGEDEEEDE